MKFIKEADKTRTLHAAANRDARRRTATTHPILRALAEGPGGTVRSPRVKPAPTGHATAALAGKAGEARRLMALTAHEAQADSGFGSNLRHRLMRRSRSSSQQVVLSDGVIATDDDE